MSRWDLALRLDERAGPLLTRIAQAITDDVRRGRLRPGDRLPGTRTLAQTLGVDRDTTISAYRQLEAEGWIEVRPARGAYVTFALPDPPARRTGPRPHRRGVPERAGFRLEDATFAARDVAPPRDTLILSSGTPDLREFPAAAYARALRRVLRRRGGRLLAYGDPRGEEHLRTALAEMLSARRALATTADDVIVVRGSQMGLDLVARSLLRPGDVVAVEALGYPPAWHAFAAAGARVVAVPVDEQGMDVPALERLLEKTRVRAVYVTPNHQYPTTVAMPPGRRIALLDFARRHGLAVVEDDYDHEFQYDSRPVVPLASMDAHGHVVYVGTLSKTLAPGLRLGYVVAPKDVQERLVRVRTAVDRQGDAASEAAVAELFREGEAQRHVRRMQRLYRSRRDAFVGSLRRHLASVLSFRVPSGGMAIWAGVDAAVDVAAWARRARDLGVSIPTGRYFDFDGRPIPFVRLNYAGLRAEELEEAVRRLARAIS
jgi:GntR family transcriptional regulator/MocR family aminotransferase